jgi:hypothetical protein
MVDGGAYLKILIFLLRRTIFCMQLSQRCRARDLEDFMSSVGKVNIQYRTCSSFRKVLITVVDGRNFFTRKALIVKCNIFFSSFFLFKNIFKLFLCVFFLNNVFTR